MLSYENLRHRTIRRIKWSAGFLIFTLLIFSHLFLIQQWKNAEALAQFYANLDLFLITDEQKPAAERVRAVHLMAAAAEQNPFGLIADALTQFTEFENKLLKEQQLLSPYDSIPGMVLIPAGNFLFGGLGQFHGAPGDTFLTDFYLDQYAVTNAEFCDFLNDSGNQTEANHRWYRPETGHIQVTPAGFQVQPGFENHPVVSVNWYGARAYARAAGKRLPTEHEWEKAARGIYGRLYPWGNLYNRKKCNSAGYWSDADITSANRDAWYNGGGRRVADTTPVTQFPEGASPYGCFDLCGNVWEWTTSDHDVQKDGRVSYVNRGGAFSYGQDQIQTAHRGRGLPEVSGSITGFRCAKDAAPGSLR